jgi:hypothetical protein
MELLILLLILNYVPCEQQGSIAPVGVVETWTTTHGNTSIGTSTST